MGAVSKSTELIVLGLKDPSAAHVTPAMPHDRIDALGLQAPIPERVDGSDMLEHEPFSVQGQRVSACARFVRAGRCGRC
jgi:hypothetical protein